jgi:outer membrane protein
MKRIEVLIIIIMLMGHCTLAAQSTSQAPQTLSLQYCIETAIAHNLQVRQAAYQADVDQLSYAQAKANRLPSLNANIGHGINQGRSIDPFTNSYINSEISFANYGIGSSITLWNGSAINQTIKQNEYTAKASEMNWQQTKDNITINVILAYLQVLSNKEQVSIAEKQIEVTRIQVERLQTLNDNGAIAPATLYDMKGQLAGDELSLIGNKNNLETAKINLCQLLNIAYSTSIEVAPIESEKSGPVLYDGNKETIFTLASSQLGILKAAELRRKSAHSGVRAAKAQLLPVLTLNGNLGTNYSSVASRQLFLGSADVATNDYVTVNSVKYNVMSTVNRFQSSKITYFDQWKNNFNSSISLGLQIPILNRLQARTRVKQAVVQEKRVVFEQESMKTQLKQEIDRAYLNMETALQRFAKLEDQVNDFTTSFKAAEARFNAGVGTVVEYMVAKNNMDRANINLIVTRYDYLLRAKLLDFYQGKPLW